MLWSKPSAAQNTEFFARKATRVRAGYLTFDTWYKKMYKKVYPATVTGNLVEDAAYGITQIGYLVYSYLKETE